MSFRIFPVLTCSLLLTACGGGDSAIDGVKEIPNRFGNGANALDDFNEGSTGDSGNTAGLEPNEVRITLEVPALYAPNAEITRRNLRIVIPDQVRVFRTNNNGQNLGEVDYSTSTGEDGHVVIAFANGQPVGPDVVIEARYQSSEGALVMQALAADSDRDVKVNPFSHYLVEVGLGGYSSDEFQAVMDCVNDRGGSLCLNKYVWATLADQVHDFEIDIAGNATLGQALESLDDRADFSGYVEKMADYALLGPTGSGTINASAADYNSVLFGLELGQTYRDSLYAGGGQWGARTTREENLGGGAYLYPALTLTSFEAFNIDVTSLATDIPYSRDALVHRISSGGSEFFREADWAENRHASSPGAATLTPPSEDGRDPARLLAGRSLYQSITDEPGSENNGWTRNPYYLDAFTSAPGGTNESPDRVLTSYFTAGKAIALEDVNGKLKRRETLEEHYLSVFELHLLRSEDFAMNAVANQDYNLVYLASNFGGSDPVVFETGHGNWLTGAVNGEQVPGETATTTFTLKRTATGDAVVAGPSAGSERWNLENRPSALSNGERAMGRLNLCESCTGDNLALTDLGLGAAAPDGTLLAFNLDGSPLGNGLVIAAEKPSAAAPPAGTYRIQGAIAGMSADANRLYQLTGGSITIKDASNALLEGEAILVEHSLADNRVNEPFSVALDQDLTYTATANGNINFSGGELELTGIFTGTGDQLFLALQDSTGPELRTGLLIATKAP